MGGLLWAIIFGAIVGGVAKAIAGGGRIKGGCLTSIFIGVVGSVVGSVLFALIGGRMAWDFSLYSFFVSVVGAVVFLWIARALMK